MLDRLYGPILAPKADRLGTYAAALAYCFVLSLIPFVVVTFTLGMRITHLDLAQAYGNLLTDILPTDFDTSLAHGGAGQDITDQHARAAAFSARILHTLESNAQGSKAAQIGFLFALFTSFSLMNQIVRTLLYIFDDHRKPFVWTWEIVIKTFALFIIWMVVLFFVAICSVVTPVIESVLRNLHLDPLLWKMPLVVARDLIGIAALYAAFFLTYILVPSRSYNPKRIRNASFVALCGWILSSLVFSYVLPHLWQTNAVYEVLGSVVIILLWAQACAWSVIIGACWVVRFPSRRRV